MSGDRTSAFLREMGIGPLWVGRDAAPAVPAPVAEAPGTGAAAPDDSGVSGLDWDGLQRAIAACDRCGKCAKPVMGSGPRSARWAVVAGAIGSAEEQEGVPLAGDAARLLDNMLAAAGVSPTGEAYVTSVVKCRPLSPGGAERAPTDEQVAACRPFVEREIALTGAATVLTLGQVATNAMLGKPVSDPLAPMRGRVHALPQGQRMVATLHPADLLRRGRDKALAWADLCLAAGDEPGT